MIEIGTIVRVTNAVHGNHDPDDENLHRGFCQWAGMEARVSGIEREEGDGGSCTVYYLDGAGESIFFADELEIIGTV